MNLIFSNTGRLLSLPTEEKSEQHDDYMISTKYYHADNGWYYSVDLKFKSCIHVKPVKETDKPDQSLMDAMVSANKKVISWLQAPAYKKVFAKFTLFDFEQLEFDF